MQIAELLTHTLSGLHPHDQTLAILGNHDTFDGNAPSVTKSIFNSGVLLLENTTYTIQRNGATLHIAGVGDVWAQSGQIRHDQPTEGQNNDIVYEWISPEYQKKRLTEVLKKSGRRPVTIT